MSVVPPVFGADEERRTLVFLTSERSARSTRNPLNGNKNVTPEAYGSYGDDAESFEFSAPPGIELPGSVDTVDQNGITRQDCLIAVALSS